MIESTRSRVIEKSVQLEELISLLICNLLDIDKENSVSFGTKSFALSFNSKINLLFDLKFLPIKLKNNLSLFSEIRNKFAHVLYVDDFTKCFEVINKNSGKNSSKNQLLSQRNNSENEQINQEVELNICFDLLCIQTSLLIDMSSQLILKKKTEDLKKNAIIEHLKKTIDSDVIDFSNELIEWLKIQLKEITPNEEFNLEYIKELNKNNPIK